MSIMASALTTGFTSALISFDTDVDVKKRQNRPMFYGYVPDDFGKRGFCFLLMTLISTVHNLSRSIGVALLAASSGKLTLAYFMFGEMLVYLAFKIIRRDFLCWIRVEGHFGVFISLIYRIVSKLVTDFTGCPHFRHPFELGGIFFTMSIVSAQVIPFAALWVSETIHVRHGSARPRGHTSGIWPVYEGWAEGPTFHASAAHKRQGSSPSVGA